MPIKVECPGCFSSITAPDTAAGKQGKCPKCGATIQIPGGGQAAAGAAESKITFPCPACDRTLAVAPSLAGRRGKCPHCQSTIQIPDPEADLSDGLIPLPDEPQATSPFEDSTSDPFGSFGGDAASDLTSLESAANPLGIQPGALPANPYGAPQAVTRKPTSAAAAARSKVMAPAICMIVVASLSMLAFIAYTAISIASGAMEPPPDADPAFATGYRFGFIVGSVIPLIIQVIVLIGAVQMLKLRSYGTAMTAAILAILPCSFFCILNTPFGIWSVIVLSSAGVKRAFR